MSRKIARESAYKLVFEFLFLKKINRKTFDILSSIELSDSDQKYMFNVYAGVVHTFDKLVAMIEELSEGFSLDRIFKADLAALLVAVYEMNYMHDIPHSVSIAEAVELAKRYSTEKSNQYVNGVLSTVYKRLNDIDDSQDNIIDDNQSIIDDSQSIIDDNQSIIDDSQSIIDDSQNVIDDSQNVIDDNQNVIDDNQNVIDDNQNNDNDEGG